MNALSAARAIAGDPVLRLVTLALICTGTLSAAVAPYQSLIAIRIFAIPPRDYAALLVVAALVAVTSSVVAGIWADQSARRRRVALILITALAVGTGLVRLLPSAASFAVAHMLLLPLGAGLFGQLFALARIVTQGRPQAERDRIAAVIRAAFAVPFVAVLPLWALAVNAGVALIDVYALGLVAALTGLVLILRSWPADASLPENHRSGLTFRAGMAELYHPAVLARMLALGLVGSSLSLYMILLGPMFTTVGGRAPGIVALFAGTVAGLEIPSMMVAASLAMRWPKSRVIALGAGIHAAFMLAFAASAHLPHVLLLTLPAGFGAGLLLTLPLSYIQDLLGRRPGAGGALIAVNQFLTAAFAALAFLIGTQISGYPLAAVTGALFVVVGGVLLLILDRPTATAPDRIPQPEENTP